MSDQTEADTQNAARIQQLDTLDRLAQKFGASLNTALTRSTTSGRSLDSVLGTIGRSLLSVAAKAATKPLQTGITGLVHSLFDSGSEEETPAFAQGGVFRAGRVTAFAGGGVVAAPTYFPMAGGTELMGEAGPEAIMPLARGADGRLGVAAGASSRPISVNVSIATPDAGSFRRSEAQVAATLARAVARGQRAL